MPIQLLRRSILFGVLTLVACSPAGHVVELAALYEDPSRYDGLYLRVKGTVLSDTEGVSMTLPVAGDPTGYPMVVRLDDTVWDEEARMFSEWLISDLRVEAQLRGVFLGKSEPTIPTPDGLRRFVFEVESISDVRRIGNSARP